MSIKLSIKFTAHAHDDLRRIYRYIFENLLAPQAAKRIMKMIEDSISHLADYPYSAPPIDDEFLAKKGYRKLVAEDYIVIYKIHKSADKVVIHRVFNGKTDYRSALKN
ncbi:MAG: type II toxin-antitoxin system RelE/ParE family toxin [Oscillospiraceae bacterium]